MQTLALAEETAAFFDVMISNNMLDKELDSFVQVQYYRLKFRSFGYESESLEDAHNLYLEPQSSSANPLKNRDDPQSSLDPLFTNVKLTAAFTSSPFSRESLGLISNVVLQSAKYAQPIVNARCINEIRACSEYLTSSDIKDTDYRASINRN